MIIAIDPGVSGGIAFGLPHKTPALYAMPETAEGLVELLRPLVIDNPTAFLENVNGYMGNALPGSRMFVLGQSFGQCLGALAALEIPTTLVAPLKWQNALDLGRVRDHRNKAAWKKHLQDRAKKLYPDIKITLKTADACLIWHAAASKRI